MLTHDYKPILRSHTHWQATQRNRTYQSLPAGARFHLVPLFGGFIPAKCSLSQGFSSGGGDKNFVGTHNTHAIPTDMSGPTCVLRSARAAAGTESAVKNNKIPIAGSADARSVPEPTIRTPPDVLY